MRTIFGASHIPPDNENQETKHAQFSVAQNNKYGNCYAPWELAGQVYKSLSFQGKEGSGRAAAGREQPREKISHFNEVTTMNKTNSND